MHIYFSKILGPFCTGPSHDPLTIDEQECCTHKNPCSEGEGICENDDECRESTKCEPGSCKRFFEFEGSNWGDADSCCVSDGM